MLCFPIGKRLAVDSLARHVFADLDAAGVCRFAIPVGETVAAETGGNHQISVLHVGSGVEMGQQAAEYGRFELGFDRFHDTAASGSRGARKSGSGDGSGNLSVATRAWIMRGLPRADR